MFYTKPLTGYLLFDFDWPEDWAAGEFLIKATTVVPLPGPYAAFVATVELPDWVEPFAAHQVTTPLASIISFVIGRPVRSPRDSYLARSQNPDYQRLAIQFPVVVAGPGIHYPVPEEWRAEFSRAAAGLVSLLLNLPYDRYISAMESIRLVHMAHLYKRDDFGLSYYLLVSSIETAAQKAIKPKMVVGADPVKDGWRVRAQDDKEFAELLTAFETNLNKSKLTERFVEFVMRYCPVRRWGWLGLEPHEMERADEHELKDLFSRLSEIEIRELLTTAYKHRSRFTHEGQSPPHYQPSSNSGLLQMQYSYDAERERFDPVVLLSFDLLSFIARLSMLAYFETLKPSESHSEDNQH